VGDALAQRARLSGQPEDYRALRERWQGGGVEVLGDKAP
jgi:hypothetical protein